MTTEELIRALIEEDQFKANYTKRQRSIFCNNLHEKISAFLEERDKETLKRIDKHEEDLHETRKKLDKLRRSYETLYKNTDTYVCVTLTYTLICLGFFLYVYYNFILYPYFTNECA
jgi:hypothetical protein